MQVEAGSKDGAVLCTAAWASWTVFTMPALLLPLHGNCPAQPSPCTAWERLVELNVPHLSCFSIEK